jgi:Family of unknown function (DUF6494)
MDEEALNTSVRKFLKKLGVTAQREIEMAVRDADAKGQLRRDAAMTGRIAIPANQWCRSRRGFTAAWPYAVGEA